MHGVLCERLLEGTYGVVGVAGGQCGFAVKEAQFDALGDAGGDFAGQVETGERAFRGVFAAEELDGPEGRQVA